MSDSRQLDPEAALKALDKLIDAEEDESVKADLRAARSKPIPGPNPKRPSFEDEAAKRRVVVSSSRSPPRSTADSARRIDFPSQEEIEGILLSDSPLNSENTKVVLLGLFKSIEMHHQYVDDTFQNMTAAIESLHRKAEFLTVPVTSQTIPIKNPQPSLFTISKGNIAKYLVNPPVTKRMVRTRLLEIANSVQGKWLSTEEVQSLSNETVTLALRQWDEQTIRKVLSKSE